MHQFNFAVDTDLLHFHPLLLARTRVVLNVGLIEPAPNSSDHVAVGLLF